MLAARGTTVVLADPNMFQNMAIGICVSDTGFMTTLILNDVIIQGWKLIDATFIEPCYRFILRTSMTGLKDTGIYACVLLSDDGKDMKVCQFILIENDDDYKAKGELRFDAFPVFQTLRG